AGASDTALAPEDLSRRRAFERLGDAIAVMASEEHPLVVTDSAVRRIRVLQQKESRPEASLRLRIIAGGCSGMQYRMDLADAPRTTDLVVSTQDVRVLVDPKSMTYLKGSKLEWEEDLRMVREDLQDLQVLDELERLPWRLVDLRDAGHVARVVERDLLRERLREGDPFLADQFLDVVGDVEDAEGRVPAPLFVVPGEGPV